MITPKVLETIRKEIIDSCRDTRYKLQAYSFILSGLDFYRAKTGEKRHFTGQELALGFAEFAHRQFGPVAWQALKTWGINSTDDFGFLVYNLIDIHLVRKQENDSLEDFFDVLDLKEYFKSQKYYTIDKAFIKSIKGA